MYTRSSNMYKLLIIVISKNHRFAYRTLAYNRVKTVSLFKTFSWYFKGSKEQHVVPEIPYSHERKKAFKTTISKLTKYFIRIAFFNL